ncbi:MAG: ATP-binding protein [Fibrobacteraceae bacterium]|nr:ATP-binding protein [Fibrobacteraceae bacterium]
MAERSLRIEAFRNIGFKDGKPWRERLVLNGSLKKGELGNLLIIIGANNSGKSNVLDALRVLGDKQISERDVTDLLFDTEECKQPKISLFARDGGDKEDRYAYTKEFKKNDTVVSPNVEEKEYESTYSNKETILNDLSSLADFERNLLYDSSDLRELKKECSLNDIQEISDEDFHKLTREIFKILDAYSNNLNKTHSYNYVEFFRRVSRREIGKDWNQKKSAKQDNIEKLNSLFKEEYEYNFIPKILSYKEKSISNDDLNEEYDAIEDNPFFIALFKSIGEDVSTVQNAHNELTFRKNMGKMKALTKKLNDKLKVVSDKFNKLYYLDQSRYEFEIDLQEEKIHFCLYKGDQGILIDYQSTGFRWFFNLFFNLLNSTELEAGDIIMMDEPATNLHVKGQRELRIFLKEFAIQNDITIIIVTHSPFLVDMDNLDELRIVVNENSVSRIENVFSAVCQNDPDSLLPIKESLTIENHILVNPDETVIFVEGITDYNYLTAFKKLFNKKGITFLPINGVGGNEEECQIVSKELIKIRKHNPILLADNDDAGRVMKKVNETDSALKVYTLGDVDEKFKTIESLFAHEDLQKFNLLNENGKFVKHTSTSTVFKNQIQKNSDSISKATKDNFEKLFKYLEEETN